jgi:hypothetical protein
LKHAAVVRDVSSRKEAAPVLRRHLIEKRRIVIPGSGLVDPPEIKNADRITGTVDSDPTENK